LCTFERKMLKPWKVFETYNLLDLDGLDLFSELNILKEIIWLENDKKVDILNYIKINKLFSKYIYKYRIMLTILVSVASASFSWKKLVKT